MTPGVTSACCTVLAYVGLEVRKLIRCLDKLSARPSPTQAAECDCLYRLTPVCQLCEGWWDELMSLDRLMEMGTKTSHKVIFEQSNQKRKVLPLPPIKRESLMSGRMLATVASTGHTGEQDV